MVMNTTRSIVFLIFQKQPLRNLPLKIAKYLKKTSKRIQGL